MDIAEVKAFNSELSALYDNKPPISKAKMSAITRGAIKAIKFYKHVVHSVEKFIQKCKPEYKIPGLYVIDSIVRQSRHQFGTDKDVFAPRFSKNLQQTFINLLRCPQEDKRNIIRVLNLWQKNSVFSAEVIQPLFDMVNPNHPIHQEILAQSNNANGSMNSSLHIDPRTTPGPHASQHTPNDGDQGKSDSIYNQLRQVLRETAQSGSQATDKQSSANFNRRLLNVDFEYESEDEGTGEKTANINITTTQVSANDGQQQQTANSLLSQMQQQTSAQSQQQTMQQNYMMNPLQLVHNASSDSLNNLGSILANPEILRHLQNLQAAQMMVNFPQLQGISNLQQDMNYFDMTQPPPGFHNKDEQAGAAGTTTNNANTAKPKSPLMDEVNNESDIEFVDDAGPQVIEIDGNDSRSPTPKSIRRRRSRSRDRSRRSRSRSRSRRFSRSRSRDRRSRRSRDRDRDRDRDRFTKERGRDRERDKEKDKEKEKEREKERERKKKGLPPIKKETLSVCSTTLWVGHLSKLVQAEDLSDAFGPIGEVLSIDLVPPRGCAFIVMNRRRDAYRALIKLDKHKIHNKSITVAWAPGKGVKGREWKDYWEAEAGVCYVPWEKLPRPGAQNATQLLDSLEEGSMLEDETLPPWLHRKGNDVKPVMADVTALTHPLLAAANTAAGMMVVPPLGQATAPKLGVGVDATRLPAALGPLGFPPHPALPLPLLPLQAFKPQPQPGLQQALHLQAMLAHQQQHQQLAAQLLLGPPPRPTLTHATIPTVQQPLSSVTSETQKDDPMDIDNADDTPAPEIISKDNTPFSSGDNVAMSDKFKNLVSHPPPAFNIPPPMLGQMPPNTSLPPTHIMPPNTSRMPPGLNISQPPPSFDKQNNSNNMSNNNNNGNWEQQRGDSKERDRDRRDRDGRRDRDRRDREPGRRERHDRDRDGPRDRDRGDMDRDRDRNRDRDRPERDRGGRDKASRWRDNSRERSDIGGPMPPGGERSLQDRLWEMANGPGPRPRQDQSPPQHRSRERSRPKDGPPEGLLGEAPIPLSRALSPGSGPPMMGRSPLLPHMAPFRIGRDDIRMRGMGPRGLMGSMRPAVWMDGPNPQFGPRFGGGPPPFNRPQFDGPPFDGPPYRDGMDGPPFNGIKSRFERPPFDREFDRPYDRDYDRQPFDGRPPFDGMGRPPFDEPRRPAFDRGGPGFDEPYDDRPPFDPPTGPPRFNRSPYDDHDIDRPVPPRPVPPRGGRSEREGRKRDGDRVSRWAVRESPEKQEVPSSGRIEQLNKAVEEKESSVTTVSQPKVDDKKEKAVDNMDVCKEVVEKDVSPIVPNVTTDAGDKVAPVSMEPEDKCENVHKSNESDSVVTKPEVKAPSPPAVVDMFSDEPVVRKPTPEPVVRQPTPEPIVRNPTPEPVVMNPTPEPIVRNPTPEPIVRNPTPEPIRNPTPEPVVRNPTPEPVVRNPTPKPVFSKPEESEPKISSSFIEHKVQDVVAHPEVCIGTPAQRKFYEPTVSVQDHRMDDDNKFNDSPSPPPASVDVVQKDFNIVSSPVREDRPREEFNQNVVRQVPLVINTQPVEAECGSETKVNTPPHVALVEPVAKPQPMRVEAESVKETIPDTDGNRSQEGRSTPCRDEPSPTSVSEITEQSNP